MPTHNYEVTVSWTGGKDGSGAVTATGSAAKTALAVPAEFGGPGGASNPEELLTSAIASCYAITFGIIAANRKLPFVGLQTEAVGQVEQNGASLKFTGVTIRPTVTLSADATDEQVAMATDMAHKADGYCLVTNAVRASVTVTVEPVVLRA